MNYFKKIIMFCGILACLFPTVYVQASDADLQALAEIQPCSDEQLAEQHFIVPLIEGNTVTLRQSLFYDFENSKLSYAAVQRLRTISIQDPYLVFGIDFGYATAEKMLLDVTYDIEWLLDEIIEGGQGIIFFADMAVGYGIAYDFQDNEWKQGLAMTFLKVDGLKLLNSLGLTK